MIVLASQLTITGRSQAASTLAAVRGRRGRLAARMGDRETADADVKALSGEDNAAERRATKATIALVVKGDAAEAERLIAKALEEGETVGADVYLDRAAALERLDAVPDAIKALKAAAAADRTLEPEAKSRLARLERERGGGLK
jgi:tetratricopeptide (TPR) repeat protein